MLKDKHELAQKHGAAQEFGDRFVSAIEDKPLKCFETYLICAEHEVSHNSGDGIC